MSTVAAQMAQLSRHRLDSHHAAPRDTTVDFDLPDARAGSTGNHYATAEFETDEKRLEWRQKQINFGKNTLGYQRYIKAVPRSRRRHMHGGIVPIDPVTPDIHRVCSKRAFNGQVLKWRRMLHMWDPEGEARDDHAEHRKDQPSNGKAAGQPRGNKENAPHAQNQEKVRQVAGDPAAKPGSATRKQEHAEGEDDVMFPRKRARLGVLLPYSEEIKPQQPPAAQGCVGVAEQRITTLADAPKVLQLTQATKAKPRGLFAMFSRAPVQEPVADDRNIFGSWDEDEDFESML